VNCSDKRRGARTVAGRDPGFDSSLFSAARAMREQEAAAMVRSFEDAVRDYFERLRERKVQDSSRNPPLVIEPLAVRTHGHARTVNRIFEGALDYEPAVFAHAPGPGLSRDAGNGFNPPIRSKSCMRFCSSPIPSRPSATSANSLRHRESHRRIPVEEISRRSAQTWCRQTNSELGGVLEGRTQVVQK